MSREKSWIDSVNQGFTQICDNDDIVTFRKEYYQDIYCILKLDRNINKHPNTDGRLVLLHSIAEQNATVLFYKKSPVI